MLSCLSLLPCPAAAFLDAEIIDAAHAVARPQVGSAKATARQQALVFMHNKDLNLMAIRGELPNEVYQGAQAFFEARNRDFVQEAARRAGLVAKTQAAKPDATPDYNPGTDTDIIVESGKKGEMITERKIKATEDAYQKQVKDYLKNSGVEPPAGKVNTDTDFMPHPDHTTPEEFTKINEGINRRGGTAYESPSAAKVEAQMRPPKDKPIPPLDIKDTGAYVSEMQNLANHKIQHADELDTLARGLSKTNPAKAKALEAEAQLLRSQASKYIDRIDKVTRVVAEQNGLPPPAKPKDSLADASKSIGQKRGTGSKTGADVVGDMGNLAVNRGVKDYTETLSRIAAKDPSKAAVVQQQIAEQIKHMSPEMQDRVIGKAKQAYVNAGGKDPDAFGKSVKQQAADLPSTGAKILNTVGTIMAISDIGNACETLEKYLAGEISGQEAAEILVDQTLTLGLIGAGKKAKSSWDTYWEVNHILREANKQNLVGYFTQWELQLRKAGIPADEARRLVGAAMLGGDTRALEDMANRLRGEGKPFTEPKLVVEAMEYGVADYLQEVGEQTWETGKGILVGAYTGIKYLVLAPSRIVEAWAQGELAEAELEYQSASQEAWMKARLFQKLLGSGVPSREALKAINDYFSGADMQKLRDLFRRLRGGYVTAQHHQQDWYCTNRPEINAPVTLPPVLNLGRPVASPPRTDPNQTWHVAQWSNPEWALPDAGRRCERGQLTRTRRYGAVCLWCPQGGYIASQERCVGCKPGFRFDEARQVCAR